MDLDEALRIRATHLPRNHRWVPFGVRYCRRCGLRFPCLPRREAETVIRDAQAGRS